MEAVVDTGLALRILHSLIHCSYNRIMHRTPEQG